MRAPNSNQSIWHTKLESGSCSTFGSGTTLGACSHPEWFRIPPCMLCKSEGWKSISNSFCPLKYYIYWERVIRHIVERGWMIACCRCCPAPSFLPSRHNENASDPPDLVPPSTVSSDRHTSQHFPRNGEMEWRGFPSWKVWVHLFIPIQPLIWLTSIENNRLEAFLHFALFKGLLHSTYITPILPFGSRLYRENLVLLNSSHASLAEVSLSAIFE